MKLFRILLLSTVMLLLVSVVVLALAPTLIVEPFLSRALATQGITLLRMEGVRIRPEQLVAAHAEIATDSVQVSMDSLQISYSIGDLLAARADTVQVGALGLNLISGQETDGSGTEPVAINPAVLLQQVQSLPIRSLGIHQLTVNSETWLFAGNLSLTPSPFDFAAAGQLSRIPEIEIQVTAQATEDSRLVTRLELSQESGTGSVPLLDSTTEIDFGAELLLAISEFEVQLPNLIGLAQQSEVLAAWAPLQHSLYGHLEFSATTTGDAFLLQSARLELTHPDDHILFSNDGGDMAANTSVRLELPVTATAQLTEPASLPALELLDLRAQLSSISADSELKLDGRLTNSRINCESLLRCTGAADLNLFSANTVFGGIRASNAGLQSSLELLLAGTSARVTAAATELSLPLIQADSWRANTSIQLQDITANWDQALTASGRFATADMEATINDVALVQPALSGDLLFDDGMLGSEFTFELADRQLLQTDLSHDLETGTGAARVELEELTLTETTPLSSYILQGLVAADLVAGTLSGETALTWQYQADAPLTVSGSMGLAIDNAAGYLQETLLVGIDTILTAQVQDNFRIISEPAQTLEIDSIDVGMPLLNLSWRYQFDTGLGTFEIMDARSDLLGGEISIADFIYDLNQPSQQMTVVLTGVNLENVVALADYPELFVDGFVSGYIPITLENGQILVNDGLVGALNPGGTIRYVSPTAAVSANSSVQLVNDALSNYLYKTMDTRVFYDSNGDLRLEVQLEGLNPDMNGGQPINLNVNITDNIPTLLRSLRAGQAISDRLEQRLRAR